MLTSSITRNPAGLLNGYENERYPLSLSEDEYAAVRAYLEAHGLEPRIGAVACQLDPTIENLVKIAMSGYGLRQDISAEDMIVGPHSLGMANAISVYAPAANRDMP